MVVVTMIAMDHPMDGGMLRHGSEPRYEKDKDDWDLPDKSFYWELSPTLRFHLDQEPGTLRMSDETAECYYRLNIMVRDSIHSLDTSLSLVNLRVRLEISTNSEVVNFQIIDISSWSVKTL
ncbi:hypothetical protein J6590_087895 [Homalodisca vitripennis]|nr:hypothetical protein J6590_087895 [Homalodisca vitripennis]